MAIIVVSRLSLFSKATFMKFGTSKTCLGASSSVALPGPVGLTSERQKVKRLGCIEKERLSEPPPSISCGIQWAYRAWTVLEGLRASFVSISVLHQLKRTPFRLAACCTRVHREVLTNTIISTTTRTTAITANHRVFNMRVIFPTMTTILMASRTIAQAGVGTITQDLSTMEAFSLQAQCAQGCFQFSLGVCPMDLLGINLGCAVMGCSTRSWQAKNDCYCRTDFQSPAQDYLEGCISSSCSVGDLSAAAASAGSIYLQYCEGKGYDIAAPASAEATTTDATKPPKATSTRTGPTAASTGNTENSTSASNDHAGISTSTLVGIVIGGVAALILLAIAVFLLCRRRKARRLTPKNLDYHNGQAQEVRPIDLVSNVGLPPSHPPHQPLPPDISLVSGGYGASTVHQSPQPYQPPQSYQPQPYQPYQPYQTRGY